MHTATLAQARSGCCSIKPLPLASALQCPRLKGENNKGRYPVCSASRTGKPHLDKFSSATIAFMLHELTQVLEILLHLVTANSISAGCLRWTIMVLCSISAWTAPLANSTWFLQSFPTWKEFLSIHIPCCFHPMTYPILTYPSVSVPLQFLWENKEKRKPKQSKQHTFSMYFCFRISFCYAGRLLSLIIYEVFSYSIKMEKNITKTTHQKHHTYFIILPINHIIIWIVQHRKSRIVFQLWFWKKYKYGLIWHIQFRNTAALLLQHWSNRLKNLQGNHDNNFKKTIFKNSFV